MTASVRKEGGYVIIGFNGLGKGRRETLKSSIEWRVDKIA